MSLTLALAAAALLSTGCSAGEPKQGPGWTPNPACSVHGNEGKQIEVPCPSADPGTENPVGVLGEKVEEHLEETNARQEALDAADELCAEAGVEDCDVEAILNEQIPYLETR